jgi:hypothetical protein
MLRAIIHLYRTARAQLQAGPLAMSELLSLPVWEEIARAKFTPEDDVDQRFTELDDVIVRAVQSLAREAATGVNA